MDTFYDPYFLFCCKIVQQKLELGVLPSNLVEFITSTTKFIS